MQMTAMANKNEYKMKIDDALFSYILHYLYMQPVTSLLKD